MKPYPKYKDSGIEWLGKVPEHWEITKVGVGYDIQLGKMLQPEQRLNTETLVPYLKANNVHWDKIAVADDNFMWASPDESVQYGIQKGDLLVCEGGEAGRSALLDTDIETYIIQNALHRVRSAQNSLIYLKYALRVAFDQRWFDIICNKATISHFTKDKFSKMDISYPPRSEQQAIASYLDKATSCIDTLIEKKEKMIELLQEKRITLITHAVTKGLDPDVKLKDSGIEWLGEVPAHWKYHILKHICKIQSGYAFDSKYFGEDGHTVVQMNNLKRGILDITDANKYPYELCPNEAELKEHDILIGMSGSIGKTGSLGNYAVVKKDNLPCYLNQRVGKLNISNSVNSSFMLYTIQTTSFFEQIQLSVTGTAQFNISPTELGNIWITSPPNTEQKMIAKFLDQKTSRIDTLIQKQEEMVTLLREYRSSLIHHAVTGKIDLRGYHVQAQ